MIVKKKKKVKKRRVKRKARAGSSGIALTGVKMLTHKPKPGTIGKVKKGSKSRSAIFDQINAAKKKPKVVRSIMGRRKGGSQWEQYFDGKARLFIRGTHYKCDDLDFRRSAYQAAARLKYRFAGEVTPDGVVIQAKKKPKEK